MKTRKMLALLLVFAMVFSIPLAASAAEDWSVVCTGLGAVTSEALPLTTEPQSWTFTSTTNADAPDNWDTAAINVTSDVAWELTVRSDSFAVSEENPWGTPGEDAFGGKAYPADWAEWLAANKAGVPCTVTAQVVDGTEGDYIVVGFSNNGVTNVYKVPTTGSLDSINLYLTGEQCVLTNLQTTTEHLDISAAVASIPTEDNDPVWSVVCTGLGAVRSEALPLTTEPQSWTFTSTTNADAPDNWDTAAIDVTSSAAWELTIRSDSFAVSEENPWGTPGEDAFGGKAYPADWAEWLAANKAGAPCTVTAQLVVGESTNYIVVGFSNNGVANVYIVPTAGALDSVNLYLTGEQCVLTDLQTTADHLDISAAVASVASAPEEPDPEEPTTPEEPEEPTAPEEPQPAEPEPEPEEPPVYWSEVDCPTWWGGHSTPVKVTATKQSWTFTTKSYASAADNWDTPTVVVWRSDDGTMGGPGYVEELLIRSDSFAVSEENYWGTDGQNSFNEKNYPADWAAWLSANKSGATCTVTAQIVNGSIIVGFSNNGVTNVYVVPMNTASNSPVYLSMTGEECTMTNWAPTKNGIDISAAVAYASSNPKTGDSTNLFVLSMAMVLAAAGIVTTVVTKKKFF